MNIYTALKDILVSKNVGSYTTGAQVTDWSIFYETEPLKEPFRSITIYRTGGENPNPAWLISYISAQIRIKGRDDDILLTASKAQDVIEALNGYPSHNVGNDRWVGIWAVGDVISLGRDKNSKPIFVTNFRMIIEPTAIGNTLTNREALP